MFSVTRNSFGNSKPLLLAEGGGYSEVVTTKSINIMTTRRKGGRPSQTDPATNCCMVRFNSTEFAKFLTLFEQSGVQNKATFIKARVFNEEFRVVKVDKTLIDYYQKLASFHAQFRRIGVNYNQLVVALKSNFTEKKAMLMLYKLEKATIELATLNRKIINLTEEFEKNWELGR